MYVVNTRTGNGGKTLESIHFLGLGTTNVNFKSHKNLKTFHENNILIHGLHVN